MNDFLVSVSDVLRSHNFFFVILDTFVSLFCTLFCTQTNAFERRTLNERVAR